MVKGWFVGDFDPSVSRSKDVEVGVKHYRAGDREEAARPSRSVCGGNRSVPGLSAVMGAQPSAVAYPRNRIPGHALPLAGAKAAGRRGSRHPRR
jgi:hypothetical protein